jgi:hypothetical protein
LLAAPLEAQPPSAQVVASSDTAIAARGKTRASRANVLGASLIAPSDIFKKS